MSQDFDISLNLRGHLDLILAIVNAQKNSRWDRSVSKNSLNVCLHFAQLRFFAIGRSYQRNEYSIL